MDNTSGISLLSNILENISDVFFTIKDNGDITYINKAVERYYPQSKESFIGINFWGRFESAKNLKYWSEFSRAIKDRVTVHFEEYAPSLNKWLVISAYPFDGGLAIYFHDITEEKSIREKIRTDEENLRMLINNTEDPIWSIDSQCRILLCNNSFKKWIQYFVGKEMDRGDNVLDPSLNRIYLDKFEMCYKLALMGKSFRAVEDWQANNEIRYSAITFNPVFNKENNSIIGVSCFARDITDQRKHLYKIEEQNGALKEIAFIQSHKVRGPVASILGLAQLFNRKNLLDPINSAVMDGIVSASNDLDLIIREVVTKANEIDI